MFRKFGPHTVNVTFQLEVSFLLFTFETSEDKVQKLYMFNKERRPVRQNRQGKIARKGTETN